MSTKSPDTQDASGVEIPAAQLSAQALRGVIESYVMREGTDYGEREFSFEQKVEQVMRQLQSGEARIYFDPDSETINIVKPD